MELSKLKEVIKEAVREVIREEFGKESKEKTKVDESIVSDIERKIIGEDFKRPVYSNYGNMSILNDNQLKEIFSIQINQTNGGQNG